MSTVEYALRRTPEEYARLRAQARMWEAATGRLLDRIGLAAGARCLDAGCGPGETMRLMAQRVGPDGRVTGIDVDAALAAQTEEALHEAGHRQCRTVVHDFTTGEPVPGGPYDLVLARLLLFHLPERAEVVRRLWAAVAPGGHLLLQDYNLSAADVEPALPSIRSAVELMIAMFESAGCNTRAGLALPSWMEEAGVGTPDGTDVAGFLETLGAGHAMLAGTFRSVLPAGLAHGVTTEAEAEAVLAEMAGDAARHHRYPMLWPLMIGAWKRR
jgi:2-polyprenyl-3-methyl-5-hydroxy-6-metoxy-1,4-benzoquinol methylase